MKKLRFYTDNFQSIADFYNNVNLEYYHVKYSDYYCCYKITFKSDLPIERIREILFDLPNIPHHIIEDLKYSKNQNK